ncbi:dolichol-phosphate mannosyltransferase [Galdieria sulphuraria]|uniref:Dolichol-phosphate mannosyltransferase n=1 Tax=Galdieria sulphuraria TaxID=130081 RepID=M2XR12_GALSU|nr:dolichol-phosphate mannosyltransferase [Galdieria sulphuraria]EME32692.1 dolichol-phosphate mannosyltransferase [Galdieria sulphuraria]|eukprot:XP_005709212.1 dolichol-phosphate mannosyltransferase [Galdieria sulphuraria]
MKNLVLVAILVFRLLVILHFHTILEELAYQHFIAIKFERGTVRYCSCSVLEANLLDSNRVRLSVVVPFYNEADSIEKLVEAVIAACEESPYASQWELICVDDGSTDGTTDKLKRLCDKYPTIKGISFRKNFGQTAALAAGFDIASGDLVATLDGDLQNDPKDIFRLIETMDAGDYDLVSGWRHCREDAFVRSKLSKAANWLIRWVTGVPVHDLGCATKVYKREVIRDIQLYGEMHRFIVVLAMYEGAKIGEREVSHYPRKFGKSKYGLDRIIRVICDLTFLYYLKKYRTRPSHLVGSLAILFSAFSLGLMVCASISKFLGKRMFRTKLSVWLLFLMTLQLIWIVLVLGILAEVVTRTYYESQNKPIYRVRKYFPEKAKIGFQ